MSNDFFARMRPHIIERNLCTIGHEECWCDIVAAEFEPRVPHFVGIVDLEKREFFISSAVPRGFRRPIIAHELFCARKSAEGMPGHCKAAVDYEISFVMPEDRAAYIALRRKFFADLLAYSLGGDEDFLQEITESHSYLCKLR